VSRLSQDLFGICFALKGCGMEKLLEQLLRLLENGRKCALCSVISREGSVPAPANAKLLVKEDGEVAGTIGGGVLEADVQSLARTAISEERPGVKNFDFGAQPSRDSMQICGGRIGLFIEVIFPSRRDKEFFSKLLHETRSGRPVALATSVQSSHGQKPPAGQRMLFNERGVLSGGLASSELNERVRQAVSGLLQQEDPIYLRLEKRLEDYPELEGFLVEFIHPAPTLVVFGGGHIGRPLCSIGAMCGFRVVAVDDRAEFSDPERFPEAERTVHSDYTAVFDNLAIGPRHYLVSVTRSHATDSQVIEQAVRKQCAYIGMIGSRRKINLIWEQLEKKGVDRALLKRVHAPVGLDIRAETPEEIAVSIMAEIIRTRREGKPEVRQRTI